MVKDIVQVPIVKIICLIKKTYLSLHKNSKNENKNYKVF